MSTTDPLPYHHATTWVVVGDGSLAQGYLRRPTSNFVSNADHQPEEIRGWELKPLADLSFHSGSGGSRENHPAGTIFQSSGHIRHLSEPHTDDRHKTKNELARRLAEALNKAKADNKFDHLVLVAPPAWLGLLRPHLSRQVREVVTMELAKDLTGLPIPTLNKRVNDILPSRDGATNWANGDG